MLGSLETSGCSWQHIVLAERNGPVEATRIHRLTTPKLTSTGKKDNPHINLYSKQVRSGGLCPVSHDTATGQILLTILNLSKTQLL